MRKCCREIYSLHADRFSEIAIRHSLFAGAGRSDRIILIIAAVHESETGKKQIYAVEVTACPLLSVWRSQMVRAAKTLDDLSRTSRRIAFRVAD